MITEDKFLSTATEIFRSELDDETLELNMSNTQNDVAGWDSLANVRIITRLEAEYGIQFEVDEIESMTSVQAIFNALALRS